MAQDKYFVSHDEKQLGPFSVEEIQSKLDSGELSFQDYLYADEVKDWVLISQCKEFIKGSGKEAARPEKAEQAHAEAKGEKNKNLEWFILKGDNKFGPFVFEDVVKMLQQKLVFEFDFAWKEGMENWKRIAELTAFDHGNIQSLQETLMPEISEVFFRRKHRRVHFNGTLLIHDNKSVWKGHAIEISAGGAGVIMENAMIVPGQKLYLHFKPCEGVPPFNAICEVISKKFVNGVKSKETPIRYGLKFTTISDDAKGILAVYTDNGRAA